ncbi:MAG: type II secretion system major pseudopilin GspG [Pseudomonadales bacterium]|nr:type II secretion system major pseudopilin GspG [Pseudomonadales bacterium]
MTKSLPLKTTRGFTLIELLIVLAILGMLAALVGPALFGNLGKGQRAQAQTQLGSFEAALDSYRLDMGRYPDSLDSLVRNEDSRPAWAGPYLARATSVPKDPWGNDYIYQTRDNGRNYELRSYGADGAPGGEGDDADIGD